MKTINSLLLAAGLAGLIGLAPAYAQAEPAPAAAAAAPLYAFVDMNRVINQSDAGKALREEIDKKGQQFQAELQKEDKTLKANAQNYEKDKTSMSKDQLAAKSADLEQKFDAAGKLLQNRKMTLSMAVNTSNKKLSDQAVDIIAKIMKEKGYTAVFSHEAVVLAAENQDITAEVLRRLNETVKHIPIDWAAASQARQ